MNGCDGCKAEQKTTNAREVVETDDDHDDDELDDDDGGRRYKSGGGSANMLPLIFQHEWYANTAKEIRKRIKYTKKKQQNLKEPNKIEA